MFREPEDSECGGVVTGIRKRSAAMSGLMFEPVKLGELALKNKFVLASLTRGRSGETRVPNDANVEYYRQRAGFGLVMSEATAISPMGEGWYDSPSLYKPEQVAGWKRVCEAVHGEGGLMLAQLWHIGRAGHSSFLPDGQPMVSASAIKIEGDGVYTADTTKQPHETPRALEIGEVEATVRDYKQAALNAKEAGFDGVEVHSANGYLIDQFLQSTSNVRTDAYGGSVENRYRFLKEIFEAVFEVFEPSRVGVKLSPNGVYNGMGSADNIETFEYVMTEIEKLGLAYVQVMDGLAFGFHEKCPPMTLPDIKKLLKTTPIVANCGYTPESADAAVIAGDAQAVAFGRPTLTNPDYVDRLKNGYPIAETLPNDQWFGRAEHRLAPEKGYIDFPAKYDPAVTA
ncbi:hypothetical protein CTAYLR_008450 [Chrysophaeum taylorii]|uniref:NADH:flavin oxidoreductase/NADH oxidase N-terminal domain-containing protein n=1 Tax=Chrysophaeum taylorii TaxID=2483200 RepID=A0AAD7UL51_9STRA|nr:hypothetical protein CTAYLR_008450 [Chrysophaeum taylorii]